MILGCIRREFMLFVEKLQKIRIFAANVETTLGTILLSIFFNYINIFHSPKKFFQA